MSNEIDKYMYINGMNQGRNESYHVCALCLKFIRVKGQKEWNNNVKQRSKGLNWPDSCYP